LAGSKHRGGVQHGCRLAHIAAIGVWALLAEDEGAIINPDAVGVDVGDLAIRRFDPPTGHAVHTAPTFAVARQEAQRP
jgi:hypothetical protein